MKILKSDLRNAVGSMAALTSLITKAGGTIVDGVYVKPYQKVTLVGYKNKGTRLVAPKDGNAPVSRRISSAVPLINPNTGKVTFVRRTQWTDNNGRACGLFTTDGAPVIGYDA